MLLTRQFELPLAYAVLVQRLEALRAALGTGAAPRIYVEDLMGESSVVERIVAAEPELAGLCIDDTCLSNLPGGWSETNDGAEGAVTWATVRNALGAMAERPPWRAVFVFNGSAALPTASWAADDYDPESRSVNAPFLAHPGELILSCAIDSARALATIAQPPPGGEVLPPPPAETRALLDVLGAPDAERLAIVRTTAERRARSASAGLRYADTDDPVAAIMAGATLHELSPAPGGAIRSPARDIAAVLEPHGYRMCGSSKHGLTGWHKRTAAHNDLYLEVSADRGTWSLEPGQRRLTASLELRGVDWAAELDIPLDPRGIRDDADLIVADRAQWLLALENLSHMVARAEQLVVPVMERFYGAGFAWFPITPSPKQPRWQ